MSITVTIFETNKFHDFSAFPHEHTVPDPALIYTRHLLLTYDQWHRRPITLPTLRMYSSRKDIVKWHSDWATSWQAEELWFNGLKSNRHFSLLRKGRSSSAAQIVSYSMSTGSPFLGYKSERGMKLTDNSSSNSNEVKDDWSYNFIPTYVPLHWVRSYKLPLYVNFALTVTLTKTAFGILNNLNVCKLIFTLSEKNKEQLKDIETYNFTLYG